MRCLGAVCTSPRLDQRLQATHQHSSCWLFLPNCAVASWLASPRAGLSFQSSRGRISPVVTGASPGKPLPQARLHFWRRWVPDASGSFSWVLDDHTSAATKSCLLETVMATLRS